MLWKITVKKKGQVKILNRKIKKYLDEIDKTEKKIEELQQYLKGVRAALHEEENSEMIKTIRTMKLQGRDLFDLLNGIQEGNISFVANVESEEGTGSFVYNENHEEREDGNYGENEEYQ